MTRSSLLVGALAATVFAASDLSAMPNDSAPVPEPAAGTVMLLAQGGSGGGGDSAGRGSDTSKGAVPQDKNYPTGQYPSGIESRGTMPRTGLAGHTAGEHRIDDIAGHGHRRGCAGNGPQLTRNDAERWHDADG